ncbi:hypothetical protein MX059_06085 [Streptococcus uberis]|nr:hypothetical protein [Streptococcus uberis]
MSNKKYLRISLLSASMFTLLAFAIINHFKVMTYYFGTSALALVLKLVIHRSRPLYQLLPDSGFSFPSGHSVCAVLLLLMVLFLLKEKPTS